MEIMGFEVDTEAAYQNAMNAVGGGLIGASFSAGNPVAIGTGVIIGVLAPEMLEYFEGGGDPADFPAEMADWTAKGAAIREALEDQGLTPQELEQIDQYVGEFVANFSRNLVVDKPPGERSAWTSVSKTMSGLAQTIQGYLSRVYANAAAATAPSSTAVDQTPGVSSSPVWAPLWGRKDQPPAPPPPPPPPVDPGINPGWVILAVIVLAIWLYSQQTKKRRR